MSDAFARQFLFVLKDALKGMQTAEKPNKFDSGMRRHFGLKHIALNYKISNDANGNH